jgi:uncharacterized cupin superfamily protein
MLATMDQLLITNVADVTPTARPGRATRLQFEPEPFARPDTGVNIHVLAPGQPACLYHVEPVQEDFLVLHGQCVLIADDQEHALRQWDLVHLPAGVAHVFVGAGDGPCAVLMIGSRRKDEVHFPVSERAARYGASVSVPTDDGSQAYADWWREPARPVPNPWPLDQALDA